MHDNAWIAGKVVSLSVSYQDTTKSQVSMQTGGLSSQSSGQRSLGVDLTAQRMVQKYPHEVTIYEGGPMTHLALANAIDPHFAELAEGLVFMGGSLSPRTDDPEFISSPRHEFNFWFDPEAAKSVLQAPWKKIVCTPVDISLQNQNH